MILSQIGGFNPTATAGVAGPETVEAYYKAGGAITVGAPVIVDVSDTTGKTVVTGTTTTRSTLMVGVYEGNGGSGSATAVTGLSGKAAVSGDIIRVKVYGTVSVIATPKSASDMTTSGKILALGTTAGVCEGYETATGKMAPFLVSLEAGLVTPASTSVIKAFARFL